MLTGSYSRRGASPLQAGTNRIAIFGHDLYCPNPSLNPCGCDAPLRWLRRGSTSPTGSGELHVVADALGGSFTVTPAKAPWRQLSGINTGIGRYPTAFPQSNTIPGMSPNGC